MIGRPKSVPEHRACSAAAHWRFAENMPASRRILLSNSPPFEEIARQIARYGAVRKQCTEGLAADKKIRRPIFLFDVPFDCDLVDIFHNGVDGYRARYLRGVNAGRKANQYILDLLYPKLVAAWMAWPRRPHDARWLSKSLATGAKVWVHQGTWALPWNRNRSVIALAVDKWLLHENNPDAKIRKKVRLGTSCPRENSIVIKGAFVSHEGAPVEPPKADEERARQIHLYGFT